MTSVLEISFCSVHVLVELFDRVTIVVYLSVKCGCVFTYTRVSFEREREGLLTSAWSTGLSLDASSLCPYHLHF